MTAAMLNRITNRIKEDWLVSFASKLVNIPSFKTEESDIAKFLASNFNRWGYEVDLQEVDPGRYQTIATLKGTGGGNTLMLNGHIDMDPLSMGWKRDPWTPSVEGDNLSLCPDKNNLGRLSFPIGDLTTADTGGDINTKLRASLQ